MVFWVVGWDGRIWERGDLTVERENCAHGVEGWYPVVLVFVFQGSSEVLFVFWYCSVKQRMSLMTDRDSVKLGNTSVEVEISRF